MSHNFSTEFDAVHTAITTETFNPTWKKLIDDLKTLATTDGPSDAGTIALDELRKQVKYSGSYIGSAFGLLAAGEDKEIITGANGYTTEKNGTSKFKGDVALIKKAAALKLLRHTYLIKRRGGQKVWLISLPKSYREWPSLELNGLEGNEMALKAKLLDHAEYFSRVNVSHIGDGVQEALKWSLKTQTVLANIGSDKGKGIELVKRWFANTGATDTEVNNIVTQLVDGFKKITSILNSHKLIFTDFPPFRGTDNEDNEAFVFNSAWKDKLHVVYIEKGFFVKGANVLSGRDNWARIIVHEISHREVPTDDYPKDGCYGWQGINPTDGKFAGNKAITNAENWAYFCADCANALSTRERNQALKL